MEPLNIPSLPPSPWPLPATSAPRARLTWEEWLAWQARHTLRRQEPAGWPFSQQVDDAPRQRHVGWQSAPRRSGRRHDARRRV
jgi:hypothetical protein